MSGKELTCDFLTYISENYGRDHRVMVAHSNKALERLIRIRKSLGASEELGFTERRDNLIADGCLRHTDGLGHSRRDERVHGVVADFIQHLFDLAVIRPDVTVSKGIEGVKKRLRGGGRSERPSCKKRAARDAARREAPWRMS